MVCKTTPSTQLDIDKVPRWDETFVILRSV